MKRQKNLIGLFALAGLIAMGVSSCKKYDDDIDQLRQEIADTKAALESALNAGKLITAVNPVTGGWDIVFSDNSKITVKNGENGAPGASGFAPVVGIDNEGYWTVVSAQGADPVRVKDASGKEVKAVASVPTANKETKTWWIDGKDTEISYVGEAGDPGKDGHSPYIDKDTNHWMVYNDEKGAFEDSGVKASVSYSEVKIEKGVLMIDGVATDATGIPSVAYNDLTHTVMVTVYDAAGKASNYEFLQASDVMVMITSVSAPIANPLIGINYGTAAGDFIWGKESFKANDLLFSDGGKVIVPVIVNPTGASLDDCKIEIVNPKDETFVIPVVKATRGYDYDKYGFKAANAAGAPAANGLWSLELGLTAENLAELNKAASGVSNLAVRVTKGEGENARIIQSGYQYKAKSEEISALANLDDVPATVTAALGEKVSLLGTLDTTLVFRDSIAYKAESVADAHKSVTMGRDDISTVDNKASIDVLEGNNVTYMLSARDYKGSLLTKDVVVTFYSSIGLDDVTLAGANLTLSTVSDTAFVSLAPMYTALGEKKGLWQTNAQNFKVVVKDAKGNVVDANNTIGTAGKFTVNFFEKGVSYPDGAVQTPASDNTKLNFVGVMADAAQVLPGSYTATITFEDKRNAAEYKTFGIVVPVVVANPAMDIQALFAHVPAKWSGNNLAVFGAAQTAAATTYVLSDAYSKTPDGANFGFEYVKPTGGKDTPLADDKTMNVSATTLYNAYTIDLYYYYFGNKANKVKVESLVATPKSLVKEGTLTLKDKKVFEVTVGAAALSMDDTYSFADYDKTEQALFGALGSEIASVAVTATGDNAKLVTVTGSSGADWTITANSQVVLDLPATVTIHLVVTDKMGAEFVKDLSLTVKK